MYPTIKCALRVAYLTLVLLILPHLAEAQRFVLYDADTDTVLVDPLVTGAVIDITTVKNLSIVALGVTSPVAFRVDGVLVNTENTPPYAIAGDTNGNLKPWTPPLGTHLIQANQVSATITVVEQVTGNGLAWADMSDNETGFTVQRQRGNDSFVTIATLLSNLTQYRDSSGLVGDCYRVNAFNGVGVSEWSNVACKGDILLHPPTGVRIIE